jgi:hypothetical protein
LRKIHRGREGEEAVTTVASTAMDQQMRGMIYAAGGV